MDDACIEQLTPTTPQCGLTSFGVDGPVTWTTGSRSTTSSSYRAGIAASELARRSRQEFADLRASRVCAPLNLRTTRIKAGL